MDRLLVLVYYISIYGQLFIIFLAHNVIKFNNITNRYIYINMLTVVQILSISFYP